MPICTLNENLFQVNTSYNSSFRSPNNSKATDQDTSDYINQFEYCIVMKVQIEINSVHAVGHLYRSMKQYRKSLVNFITFESHRNQNPA